MQNIFYRYFWKVIYKISTMNLKLFLVLFLFAVLSNGCRKKQNLVENNFTFADAQLKYALLETDSVREKLGGKLYNPRTLDSKGNLKLVAPGDWTSGFFPGELWYMYEYTGQDFWKQQAQKYTGVLEGEKNNGRTHDMGFKMYCSYGNGQRISPNEAYREVLMTSARTLATRFREKTGCLRSWDHSRDKWAYPVIIDNMMNLELLFWAFRESGDSLFYHIAVSHAKTTMKNHFREDYSSFHVVNYDTLTGAVLDRHTHQGYAHGSAWARGQAWGLYGYVMCFRETGDTAFLNQARHIADFIFTHRNLPEDLIPYWDFNAPGIPDEPRDVSAATVTASALYELCTLDAENRSEYKMLADKMMENLTQNYRAEPGKDRGFLLLHSTGSKPHRSEVDVPLVYADYYFLEALLKKRALENATETKL